MAKSQIAGTVPFVRLWNPGLGDYFHSLDAGEIASATTTGGYRNQGTSAFVADTNISGTVPFIRLYHPGGSQDHFHTTNPNEAAAITAGGAYVNEGPKAYVWQTIPSGWSLCP
jgi:hypothetical protein